MSWIRYDDKFSNHPKVLALGNLRFAAMGVHLDAQCYVSSYLTDGTVPAGIVRKYPRAIVEALVSSGLWRRVGDGDIAIHDYLEYNPSKSQVMAEREIAKRRSAMNADPTLTATIRQRDGDNCRYCGRRVNWRDRRSPIGGTYDHVLPLSSGGGESEDNLVVACRACNLRKARRTPVQAGMVLLIPRSDLGGNQTEPGIYPVPARNPVPIPERSTNPLTYSTRPARRRLVDLGSEAG